MANDVLQLGNMFGVPGGSGSRFHIVSETGHLGFYSRHDDDTFFEDLFQVSFVVKVPCAGEPSVAFLFCWRCPGLWAIKVWPQSNASIIDARQPRVNARGGHTGMRQFLMRINFSPRVFGRKISFQFRLSTGKVARSHSFIHAHFQTHILRHGPQSETSSDWG